MNFTQNEIVQANIIFNKLREELHLPYTKLELSPYRPIFGEKGNIDKNGGITVFAQKLTSFDDLILTIRHETRHLWQQINFPEHVKWWHNNMQYYNDLKACKMLYKFCTIEADAEQFARYNDTQLEGLLIRSVKWLEDTKEGFYRTYKRE